MYRNFKLTDEERKQILEMHQSHGYKKVINPIEEQSVTTSNTGSSSPVSKPSSSVGQTSKSNPMEWFKQFPCIVNNKKEISIFGNKAVFQGKVLLAQTGYDDDSYEKAMTHKPHKGMVGKVQGGGCYLCDSKSPDFIVIV